jgi:hypothetical protein
VQYPVFRVYGSDFGYVEIFDINSGKVINMLQSNNNIQNVAIDYLNKINGIYPKFDPIPISGYGIKIPFDPKIKVENKWVSADINQLIIMLPEDGSPYFLAIFESETKLVCFTFDGASSTLLDELGIQLKHNH